MRKRTEREAVNRIIDANINRAKEGLRVCEEIARFTLENHALTKNLKLARHGMDSITKKLNPSFVALVKARKSREDVGRQIYINELKRKNLQDVFYANIQRVKESIRVLEEFSKLSDKNSALQFKKLRYAIYELEKKAVKRIAPLSDR